MKASIFLSIGSFRRVASSAGKKELSANLARDIFTLGRDSHSADKAGSNLYTDLNLTPGLGFLSGFFQAASIRFFKSGWLGKYLAFFLGK
ncbi:hypothetical protein GDO81_020725 [Engystomops pustulosus]|uniref:Uncharacterized protein n=1 Tax=Engystomops pustulosus TaxID=76066 RepID=A0AAV6Z027_ENGPU|nr:hypothetical protein GDO81_020725 [Engystomops pustulosus]